MKKISYYIIIFFSFLTYYSCDEEGIENTNLNYVTFGSSTYSSVVDLGGSVTVDVVVLTANKTGSNRTFSVSVDDDSTSAGVGSYSVPDTVTISGGSQEGVLTVTLNDQNLGIGVNTLVLNLVEATGLFTGESTSISYIQQCNEVTATLEFTFDDWPEEIAWTITDALGGVVASADVGTYAGSTGTSSENIILCQGRDYTFNITDDFGDGAGPYSLSLGGTVVVSGNGLYGSGESTAFNTN